MRENIIKDDLENIYNRDIPWESFQEKTVLVTGAYGMLASYIVYFLMFLKREKHMDVSVIAQGRSRDKARERFQHFWDDENFHFTDINILEGISDIGHADYIVHAAGLANPQLYTTHPIEVIEPNAIGTYRLLQFARNHHAEGFLFFSSGDVYGNIEKSREIDENMVGTMDPLDMHSCYGESKRLGEALCASFYREYGLRTCSARIAHTYGPTMNPYGDPRVFASFMRCVLENRDIEIMSDGLMKRTFCYIADATAAFFLILLKGQGGEAYNVCNEDEFLSIRELAEIIASLDSERHLKVIFSKRDITDSYLESKDNRQSRPVANKLKELGWTCSYTARGGFRRVYDYLQMKERDGNLKHYTNTREVLYR